MFNSFKEYLNRKISIKYLILLRNKQYINWVKQGNRESNHHFGKELENIKVKPEKKNEMKKFIENLDACPMWGESVRTKRQGRCSISWTQWYHKNDKTIWKLNSKVARWFKNNQLRNIEIKKI